MRDLKGQNMYNVAANRKLTEQREMKEKKMYVACSAIDARESASLERRKMQAENCRLE